MTIPKNYKLIHIYPKNFVVNILDEEYDKIHYIRLNKDIIKKNIHYSGPLRYPDTKINFLNILHNNVSYTIGRDAGVLNGENNSIFSVPTQWIENTNPRENNINYAMDGAIRDFQPVRRVTGWRHDGTREVVALGNTVGNIVGNRGTIPPTNNGTIITANTSLTSITAQMPTDNIVASDVSNLITYNPSSSSNNVSINGSINSFGNYSADRWGNSGTVADINQNVGAIGIGINSGTVGIINPPPRPSLVEESTLIERSERRRNVSNPDSLNPELQTAMQSSLLLSMRETTIDNNRIGMRRQENGISFILSYQDSNSNLLNLLPIMSEKIGCYGPIRALNGIGYSFNDILLEGFFNLYHHRTPTDSLHYFEFLRKYWMDICTNGNNTNSRYLTLANFRNNEPSSVSTKKLVLYCSHIEFGNAPIDYNENYHYSVFHEYQDIKNNYFFSETNFRFLSEALEYYNNMDMKDRSTWHITTRIVRQLFSNKDSLETVIKNKKDDYLSNYLKSILEKMIKNKNFHACMAIILILLANLCLTAYYIHEVNTKSKGLTYDKLIESGFYPEEKTRIIYTTKNIEELEFKSKGQK